MKVYLGNLLSANKKADYMSNKKPTSVRCLHPISLMTSKIHPHSLQQGSKVTGVSFNFLSDTAC